MIYILGSISVGKTSLTKILSKDLQSKGYYEDVENNQMINNKLAEFYKDRPSNAGMLQVAFLTTRFTQFMDAVRQSKMPIMDSSLLSDLILCSNLHDEGSISDSDYNIYTTLNQLMTFSVAAQGFNVLPDISVYIKISPEHELESIKERGRSFEIDPSLEAYYRSVNKAYRNWSKGAHQQTLITVDRDKYDFVNNKKDRNYILDLIEKKLVDLGKLPQKEFEAIKIKRE